MKRCKHHHHHHHHFYRRHSLGLEKAGGFKKPGGFIKRTIKGLARKLNVSKTVIIVGFVVLFMFTRIFALLAFLVAYYWVRNPGRLEDFFDAALENGRRVFYHIGNRVGSRPTAAAAGPGAAHYDNEFDFSELKQRFDDLEKRTNGMEERVSSDEYRLNKEFENI